MNHQNRFYPIPNEMRLCSGSALKMVAIVTMLIDHIGAGLVYALFVTGHYPSTLSSSEFFAFYRLLRSIGRVAFPIFCFLVVEGLLHTRSKWRYLLRMVLFAFLSEIPFDLAVSVNFTADNQSLGSLNILQVLQDNKDKMLTQQNVFFTLAIGLAVIICMDFFFRYAETLPKMIANQNQPQIRSDFHTNCDSISAGKSSALSGRTSASSAIKKHSANQGLIYTVLTVVLYLLAAALSFGVLYVGCIGANILGTDYKWVGVMLIAFLYLLRKNVPMSAVVGYVFFSNFQVNELWAFPGFILMVLYNEKRGFIQGRAAKYFFYAFYPVHLFIIYLIRVVVL